MISSKSELLALMLERVLQARSFLLLFLLGPSCFFLHAYDFLLFLELLRSQKLAPLLIEMRLLRLDVKVYGFSSQLLRLLVQLQNSRDVFFPPHSLPLDEFHVPFVIITLFVFKQCILDGDDVLNIHLRVAASI